LATESSSAISFTLRQRTEATVYNERVRGLIANLRDEDLRVDPVTPPFPNAEHIDFLSFALGRLPQPAGARVLEVGSGPGSLSVYLALQGAHVTGVDVSEENVALARRRAAVNGVAERIDFRVVPIEQLDDPDGTYDFIIGNQVLHHFELEQAMPNIRRVLKPGGRAVFCEPVLLLPAPLRRLRDQRWVKRFLPKRVDTPTERSVSLDDLALIRRVFVDVRLHPFQLLARLRNFVDLSESWVRRLTRVDAWLLKHVSPLRPLCRFVVLETVRNERSSLTQGRNG
jgi:2-polyprenyl-3-methyl-5-hydroxy-6-metoxy-1,4-benzoquinol methylase